MSVDRFKEIAYALGREEDEVFSAPWEARAFAIALGLSEAGLFTWDEFRERLITEVGKSDRVRERDGTSDEGEYYQHFVRALEAVVTHKGIASAADIEGKIAQIETPAA